MLRSNKFHVLDVISSFLSSKLRITLRYIFYIFLCLNTTVNAASQCPSTINAQWMVISTMGSGGYNIVFPEVLCNYACTFVSPTYAEHAQLVIAASATNDLFLSNPTPLDGSRSPIVFRLFAYNRDGVYTDFGFGSGWYPGLNTFCPSGYTRDSRHPGICHLSDPNLQSCPIDQDLNEQRNLGCDSPNNSDAQVGNPCNTANGNKYQAEHDYRSTDPVSSFSRHYNSLFKQDIGFGVGWTSVFHKRREITGLSSLMRRADGRGEVFNQNLNQWFPGAGSRYSLSEDTTGLTLTLPDGATERYDLSGKILSEIDRSGKQTTYSYRADGKLERVTNPFGHVFVLDYDSNGHVSSMTDPSGQAIFYTYDSNNNLARVDYPDGTAKLYHYEDTHYPNNLTGISYVDAIGTRRYSTYAYDPATGNAVLTQLAQTDNGAPQERFSISYEDFMGTRATATDAVGMQHELTFRGIAGGSGKFLKDMTSKVNLSDSKSIIQTFDIRNRTCRKDEENRITLYSYNNKNQRVSMTEGLSGSDCQPCLDNPVSCATPATRTTTYQYLSENIDLPVVVESPSVASGRKKTTTIQYTDVAHPNMPTVITQSGYTPSGSAVSRTLTMGYDSVGSLNFIDGPRTDISDITTFEYYNCTSGGACGQLKKVTNALGHVTSYDSYDAGGRVTQITDPNGLRTNYNYDARGRVRFIIQTPPSGAVRTTEYRYDAAGNVRTVVMPDGVTLAYDYDAAQYLRTITDNLGNRISYHYDLKGNRDRADTIDPDGSLVRTVSYAYDLRNRVSAVNAAGSVTQQIIDAVGNLIQEIDPNNNPATQHVSDALNRVTQTIDRMGGPTSYVYNVNDHLVQVQTPNGATTGMIYDDLGNLIRETSPDRGVTSYVYDTAGNMRSMTDARGIITNYTYDALNRIASITYPDSAENVSFNYDTGVTCGSGIGRLCSQTDQSGTTTYAYDAFGNITLQSRVTGVSTVSFQYSYDAANRVQSITYPDGSIVTYLRDPIGRVSGVDRTVNGITTALLTNRQYRADGLVTGQTFGNGLTETRSYDLQGRLQRSVLGTIEVWDYPSYDANGNLKSLSTSTFNATYAYDPLDRLQSESGSANHSFGYDGNGNRLDDSGTSYIYEPSSNRLAFMGTTAWVLDPAGNTLSDQGGARIFTHNNAGQLTQAAVNGVQVASYRYNAQHQRTQKTLADGTAVHYHYDIQGNLILETTAGGEFRRAYVWAEGAPLAQIDIGSDSTTGKPQRPLPCDHGNVQGKGRGCEKGKGREGVIAHRLDMPEQAKAKGLGGGSSGSGGVNLIYLHTDHLNTSRLATNSQGAVVWRWEGAAFGDTLANEDPDGDGVKTTINFRYPGQYFDSETGLHYNWHRYYDPKIGRFITSDPIGLYGGLNAYAYVGGNPLHWFDFDGLKITGKWIKKPWAHGLNVEYRGGTAVLPQDWKWLPPSYVWRILHFQGSAMIGSEIECTDEEECQQKKTWNISPTFDVSSPFNVPLRHYMFTHWTLTTVKIAQAGKDAYKLLENWTALQAAAYAAIDPTTWCLVGGGPSTGQ